jgi:hypothetical protein
MPAVQSRIEGEPMSRAIDLVRENAALYAQAEELRQAVGLLTTLAPRVVVNPDHPLEMAKEIEATVSAQVEELMRDLGQVQRWADGLVMETQRLQGIEQRAEQAEAQVEKLTRERELIRKRLRHEVSIDEAYRLMDTIQQGWRDIAARKLREEHRRRQQAEAKLAKAMEALRSIATNTCCDSCQEAGLVARAALAAARDSAPAEKEEA